MATVCLVAEAPWTDIGILNDAIPLGLRHTQEERTFINPRTKMVLIEGSLGSSSVLQDFTDPTFRIRARSPVIWQILVGCVATQIISFMFIPFLRNFNLVQEISILSLVI